MAERFLYNAHAIGFSGQLTKPANQLIPSQAASALPPAGGYSSARQDSFRYLEVLSHGGSTSEVKGSLNPKTQENETSATATIQDLNVGNVVLLDSCTAQLSSAHPVDGSQPRITPQGSFFQNLRVAGKTIELESRVDIYTTLDTLDKLSEHYKNDKPFRDRFLKEAFVGNEGALHEKQRKYFSWRNIKKTDKLPASTGGIVIVPLFQVLNPSAPGFQVNGNTITVENFGTIVLGELLISAYERRLTMLHVDLGSGASACSVGANGGQADPP
ncbi:MAG TPA: choice-of-anchor P family protein [Bryobacteraceae bacterium]|jgi:hypothetical protein